MVEIFDNIREIYEFEPPGEELKNYIEFFSETSLAASSRLIQTEQFSVKMFSSWTPTFWINLGASYQLDLGQNRYLIQQEKDILLLRNGTVTRYNQANDHIFSIKFFPGGLEAILNINQTSFIDQIIALDQIIPPELIHKIKHAGSFVARMDLLQTYFLLQFQKRKQKDHYLKLVQDLIETYNTEELRLNTSELAEKTFVSTKSINRYFHRVVGVSPKKYFATLRARTALNAFVQAQKHFNPEEYGYYDMSHFYKAVIGFTGQRMLEHKR